ncbi:DUF2256 domain-containing protein [Burkholderia vietnamiensis]|uniref:DUF2256 domain-containing protein n=1 Tax=Burkholderia vietnamiensis TaxID=60552 RepID=UPI0015924B2F|nr:DUF2256 domain-containing protein [Burkholderia vietnamiensis]MDN8073027.1 DUF2256 domain-containing protein [Burkholderia vietnamiensis]HDR8984638.1 DUF2256 domain-containing protein [Burkholderia vietnamiensis]
MVDKTHLPRKRCAACGLPFSWRKKWKAVWKDVRYCSDRCRRNRRSTARRKSVGSRD